MNKTTIWEILDTIFKENPQARLSVSNKTKEITIDGFGKPAPVLGNLEEIYKKNKSKPDKTAKELLKIVNDFLKKEDEQYADNKRQENKNDKENISEDKSADV